MIYIEVKCDSRESIGLQGIIEFSTKEKLMPYMKKSMLIKEARKTGKGSNVWIEILKFVAIVSILNIIVTMFGETVISAMFENMAVGKNTYLLKYLYGDLLGVMLVIVYCLFIQKRTIKSIGLTAGKIGRQYIKGLCIGFFLFTGIVIGGLLLNTFYFYGRNENANAGIIFCFGIGFMIQGLYEELVFRGLFLTSMIRKNSVLVSIVVSSIFFGITHSLNNGFQIMALVNLVILGTFESIYMLKTDNIWGVSAIHGMWNFTQGNICGFNISGMNRTESVLFIRGTGTEILSGGNFGIEGSLYATMGLVIVILLCYIKPIKWHKAKYLFYRLHDG